MMPVYKLEFSSKSKIWIQSEPVEGCLSQSRTRTAPGLDHKGSTPSSVVINMLSQNFKESKKKRACPLPWKTLVYLCWFLFVDLSLVLIWSS